MNLGQLQTLIAIVEQGSFARAGNALGTTQSTVSARIRELERFLGAELFDRTGHRVRLTARGEEVLDFARQFVGRADAIRRRLRDPRDISGLLRVGVAGLIAHTWLPALVVALHERHPRITLRLRVGLTRTLLQGMREGRLDLAMIAGPVRDHDLHSESLGYDVFAWMAGAGLNLPRRVLGPEDLRHQAILGLTEESYHYPVIEQWFRESGIRHRNLVSCNSMDVIAALTVGGLGVSLLPQRCYRSELDSGRLRILPTQPAIPAVEFFLITRRSDDDPISKSFIEVAREVSDLSPEP